MKAINRVIKAIYFLLIFIGAVFVVIFLIQKQITLLTIYILIAGAVLFFIAFILEKIFQQSASENSMENYKDKDDKIQQNKSDKNDKELSSEHTVDISKNCGNHLSDILKPLTGEISKNQKESWEIKINFDEYEIGEEKRDSAELVLPEMSFPDVKNISDFSNKKYTFSEQGQGGINILYEWYPVTLLSIEFSKFKDDLFDIIMECIIDFSYMKESEYKLTGKEYLKIETGIEYYEY
jgi:ABC-type multidrug transport system fused ATPase/permease subunit